MNDPSPTATNGKPASGRDSHGRFAPGNRLAKGNPLARQVQELRCTFIDEALRVVEGEDPADRRTRMERVAHQMFDRAEQGDVAAARFCAEYSLGKPKQVIEVDRTETFVATFFDTAPGGPHGAKKQVENTA